MVPIASRNKGALCHLAPFTLLGIVVVPYALKSMPDEEQDFVEAHARGAILYQLLGVLLFGFAFLLLSALWDPASTLDRQVTVGFLLVVILLALLVYLLGLVVFAMQAWSGRKFDLSWLNRWVYDEP